MPKQSNNLLLNVSLVGITPKIWRELVVPKDAAFFDLHVWLQDAMGWRDSHLHQFWTVSPYGRDAYRSHNSRISYPYPEMEEADEVVDERKEKLSKWFTQPKTKLWYEYDFGDGWIHEVVLQKFVLLEKGAKTPRITAGKRACPPEDSGGIGGYAHLLEAIADPKHADHQEMMEWLEVIDVAPYNPEQFDVNAITFTDTKKRLREFKAGFGV